ncbi:PAC2 family protein [Gulosibacter molinativorax]|uniref:PAC2 family protein n=1 Tax=Gulosibacter molinativorax TaxID=256821 RepID=UPI0003F5A0CA|nr:PAC2 family protein [Gulosibacter molinativorax]QUY61542.1 PAC2 (Proteasome assembly chaperone) family [Gulosibacter molinativorax]
MTDSSRPTSFRAGRTLVLAMLGWSDAGEAASEAVDELQQYIGVNRVISRIDDEDYYDYSMQRPRSEFNANNERVIRWPATTMTGPIIPQSVEDAALDPDIHRIYTLTGSEPSLRWRSYAREVIELIQRESITRIVIVGALLADAPHTRDIQVFLTSDDPVVRRDLGIEESKYEGPTGIPGVLSHAAREAGLQVVSMWASVPHYTSNADNSSPKAQLAILDKLSELLGFEFDRGELLAEALAWEKQITEAVDADEDLRTYIRYLEEARDVVDSEAATGDAIAAEFERFLAKDDHRDEDGERGNEPRS